MTLYTLVDEGYNVLVYKNRSRLARMLSQEGLALEECQEEVATYAQIMKALATDSIIRLYAVDANDWTYRVETHPGAK
jgi:hypothetical protein